jgi:hypothetical protein
MWLTIDKLQLYKSLLWIQLGTPTLILITKWNPLLVVLVKEGTDSPSNFNLWNIEGNEQCPPIPTPHSIADYGGPPPLNSAQWLDGQTDLHVPPGRTTGRSHITLPDVFDGRKENY